MRRFVSIGRHDRVSGPRGWVQVVSMEDLQELIAGAPRADAVTLATRVVVERGRATAAQLAEIGAGEPLRLREARACCELEIGGQVVARGRIERRRGVTQFVCEEVV